MPRIQDSTKLGSVKEGSGLKKRAAGADEEGLALEFGSFLVLSGEGIIETDGDPSELVE